MKRANGTGSITKLTGNRRNPWRVRVATKNSDGRTYRVNLGCYKTKKEAVEALAAFQTNPRDLSLDKLTFKNIYDRWVDYEFPLLSKERQYVYKRMFEKCFILHNVKFKELRHTDFSMILDESTHSMGIEIKNLFSKVSKFAMKNDLIEKDYSQFLEYRKKHEVKREKKIFTNEEIHELWNNLYKYEEVDTTLIMIYSGLRIGEIIAMKKENVDLETGIIKGAGIKTDAGKKRVVPIHSKIYRLILNRYKMTSSEYIFEFPGNTYGAKHQHYRRALDKLIKELGLHYHSAHDCRHTFATLLNNADANTTAIKNIIGHSSFDLTEQVYTHKSIDELKKAIEKIN